MLTPRDLALSGLGEAEIQLSPSPLGSGRTVPLTQEE